MSSICHQEAGQYLPKEGTISHSAGPSWWQGKGWAGSALERKSLCCFFLCQWNKHWSYKRQRLADAHQISHPVHMAVECIFWGGCSLVGTDLKHKDAHILCPHTWVHPKVSSSDPMVSSLPILPLLGPWPTNQAIHHCSSGVHILTYFMPLLPLYKVYCSQLWSLGRFLLIAILETTLSRAIM